MPGSSSARRRQRRRPFHSIRSRPSSVTTAPTAHSRRSAIGSRLPILPSVTSLGSCTPSTSKRTSTTRPKQQPLAASSRACAARSLTMRHSCNLASTCSRPYTSLSRRSSARTQPRPLGAALEGQAHNDRESEPEKVLDALCALDADGRLLFAARFVRLFAYGALSVVLVLYVVGLGLSEADAGVLLTATLLGDTLVSLYLTTQADRIGRRRMLIFGTALMVGAG